MPEELSKELEQSAWENPYSFGRPGTDPLVGRHFVRAGVRHCPRRGESDLHFWPLETESHPCRILDLPTSWGNAKKLKIIEIVSLKMKMPEIASFRDTSFRDVRGVINVEVSSVTTLRVWNCDKDCIELLLRVVQFPLWEEIKWDGEVEKVNGGRSGYSPLIEKCAWND